MKLFYNKYIIAGLVLSLSVVSCKKMLDVDPPVDVVSNKLVFEDKSTAISAMSGIYGLMGSPTGPLVGINGMSINVALKADELTPLVPEAYPDYRNNTENVWGMWQVSFRDYLYQVNSMIEGLAKSKSLDLTTKRLLDGEAKFTRAFIYFYMVNFYGDVPLVLTTDYKANSNIPRSPVATIYAQMVSDLQQAGEELDASYRDRNLLVSAGERVRPNRFAAAALLARVYLYQQRWKEAEEAASSVIADSRYTLLQDLDEVFLKNSAEAIWQIQPNGLDPMTQVPLDPEGANTPDGRWLLNPFGIDPFFQLSENLRGSFEPQDLRLEHWITTAMPSGFIVPFKYKQGWSSQVPLEYTMALRLSEQYLIRAEARANLGKLSGPGSAVEDLNQVRARAGLDPSSASGKSEILESIYLERRHELFLEWGHRWLDLKRTGRLDEVMREVVKTKGGTWQSFKSLLAIPYDEFQNNPALRGHQNPGYNEKP